MLPHSSRECEPYTECRRGRLFHPSRRQDLDANQLDNALSYVDRQMFRAVEASRFRCRQ